MPITVNLTTRPEIVDFPNSHYVFIERVGNIPANAPGAWKAFDKFMPVLMEHNQITAPAGVYALNREANREIYRAGFLLAAPPVSLPAEIRYERLSGGRYVRFMLTGPFDQLPEATKRAFEIIAEEKISLGDGFNIEQYLTDPSTTPADQNITAILFTVA
ncbi:MAG: GyrI-like domain-containing protein [Terracidiphilus sp.]